MRLNEKQTIALDNLEDKQTSEGVFGGGAGGGKSVLGCYWLSKQCIRYPNTRWLMGRAKLKTLKETTLNSFLWVCSEQGMKAGVHYTINNQNQTITFFNKSTIFMKDLFYYPSDPNFDELGSLEITGAFVDECNQITEKAWNITMSRIRYRLDENNLIPKMFGTCNPSKNYVHRNFYRPWRDGILSDQKFFVQALVGDNPDISRHYIANLEKLDKESRERLLYGNWDYDADPSVLIEYEKSVDLFTNLFVNEGPKYITADIARLGEDRTIIRVWSGLISIKKVVIPKSLVDQTAAKIRQIQSEYSVPNLNTVCDEDGVGGGVVDILRCKGFVNNSRAIEIGNIKNNYANLRSQCYFLLADAINTNKIFLSDTGVKDREEIIEELAQIKQKDFDKDGKLAIIPKDEIKKHIGRSPDEADCLMMRMFFELNQPKAKGHRIMNA